MNLADSIARLLPLAAVLAAFVLACCWRTWLQHRRHGDWGIVLFRSGSGAQHLRDAMLVALFPLLFGQAVAAAAWPDLVPVSRGPLAAAGAALLAGGTGLLVAAQLHLGASWRIGIDESAKPGLVSRGLYRFSRNPIYLALLVVLAGYTLLLPTALSLVVLFATIIGIRRQVGAEERYLEERYGEEFREYARRVARFLPGAGKLIGAVILGVVVIALYYGYRLATIGTAYVAKILCSGVFVSQRDPAVIVGSDLAIDDIDVLRHLDARVDREARAVTADIFGLARRKAVFREGRGCAVMHGGAELSQATVRAAMPQAPVDAAMPRTDALETRADPRFQGALDWAFSEPDPAFPRRTRAVVVLHQGRVAAERYAEGFTRDTPLAGWSMTKSVTHALAGILAREGRISLADPVPIAEWQGAGDPRKAITLDHLLRMSSGLRFDEDYGNPLGDVIQMLLAVPDTGRYAATKALEAEPGSRWRYSSGTTNIITYAMRRVVGEADYASFPRHALFDRIGMESAVMESDASGTFVGSSFMYATARDWARFGLLYLRDGVWAGERILPEGWVRYARTAAPAAPRGEFGAHFWLRLRASGRCGFATYPIPDDAYYAAGHEGQYLTIIPSRDLVIVRLGLTRHPCGWDQGKFIRLVLDALEK